jgi:hypothetical protein
VLAYYNGMNTHTKHKQEGSTMKPPYNAPHTDTSGDSRAIVIASVIDDCGTGGRCVMHLTPNEEREYNDGMAALADMG